MAGAACGRQPGSAHHALGGSGRALLASPPGLLCKEVAAGGTGWRFPIPPHLPSPGDAAFAPLLCPTVEGPRNAGTPSEGWRKALCTNSEVLVM